MTFKFKTKVRTMKAVITAFTSMVEELTFDINPERIKCKARDPSHVMLVDITWAKDQFEAFECIEPKVFGVIVGEMNKILKRFSDDETLDVSLHEGGGLMILKTGKKEYEMRLIAPNTEEVIPEVDTIKVDFTCNFETTMHALNGILDDVSAVDEFVKFTLEDKRLLASGSGDSARAKIEFLDNVEGICEGSYNLAYFQGMTKSMGSFTDRVSISIGSKTAIRLKMFITDKLNLTYILAPKI